MLIAVLRRISAFVFVSSCLLFSHQESTKPPEGQQTNPPAQQQPTNSSPTPPETQHDFLDLAFGWLVLLQ